MVSPPSLNERFWDKVDRSGKCWIWLGARLSHGYGRFKGPDRVVSAHRYAFELANGPIPDGMCVCHSCDNPSCVNPTHLWLGTRADNTKDMVQKGRHGLRLHPNTVVRGEQHGNAKLTESQVKEIRHLYATGGVTQRYLAKHFGVGKTTISHVVKGDSWRGS